MKSSTFCATVVALSGSLVFAQESLQIKPRGIVRPSLPYQLTPGEDFADLVVVKFREGLTVRLDEQGMLFTADADLRALIATIGSAEVSRLFSRSAEDLDAERVRLQPNVPADEEPLADLNNYYQIKTSGVAETERLVNALNAFGAVETAYAEPIPHLVDDLPPTTPSFTMQQGYLAAAPQGFEWNAIRSVVGARAQDHAMGQLEGSWVLGHEDCRHLDAANYLGSAPSGGYTSAGWRRHGTACVGIMAAGDDAYGVTGLASGCDRVWLGTLTDGSANIISLATAQMSAGDAMSSSYVFTSGSGHRPLDYAQAQFDAVRAASAAGIHYTFSAGNTSSNLDDQSAFGTRYLPTSASSNGYIIGATNGEVLARASFSSYGTRIDAAGWGRRVATIGYGSLFSAGGDDRQNYTAAFNGTSSAAPCIAGVIASYAGAVQEQNGVVLTTAQVRQDLDATGLLVPGAEHIGNRPNLVELLALHGLPDGMLVNGGGGAVGGSFTYEVSGNAGEAYGALLSSRRARVDLGFNRDLLIDLSRALSLGSGALPGSGSISRTLSIPNVPALRGSDFFLQAAVIRAGSVHLTNSAELLVR